MSFEAANSLKGANGFDINLLLDDGATAVPSGTPVPGEVDGSALIFDLLDGKPATADLSQLPLVRVVVNVTSTTGDGIVINFEESSSSTFASTAKTYPVGSAGAAITEAIQYELDVRPKNRYVRIVWDGGASLTAATRPNPAAFLTAVNQ